MAKKKSEEADDFVARLGREIEKDYGEGILATGEQITSRVRQVIPISPVLDCLTGGGIKEGSWVGITGKEKSGKTTTALSFAAQAQKPQHGNRPIYYANVEGRFEWERAREIAGLDISPGRFNLLSSQEGRILSQQDYLRILSRAIKMVPGAVIIIDSISAFCEEKELNEGVGTETRGGTSKHFAQFIRTMANVVPVNRTIVIGMTQMIANSSGYGLAVIEKTPFAWRYQRDYLLRIKSHGWWKANEKVIGVETNWICDTTSKGIPGMEMTAYLRFGLGCDELFELIKLGMAAGLVRQAGSWFFLDYLLKPENKGLLEGDEVPKALGAEKIYQMLREKGAWASALRKEVLGLYMDGPCAS